MTVFFSDYLRRHRNIFLCSFMSWYWYSAGSWDRSPWKTGTHVSYIVNIVTADDLATQGATVSVAMVLTYFSWNIPVSTPERLIFQFFDFHCVYESAIKLRAGGNAPGSLFTLTVTPTEIYRQAAQNRRNSNTESRDLFVQHARFVLSLVLR